MGQPDHLSDAAIGNGSPPSPASPEEDPALDEHTEAVVRKMFGGLVVPFLGAGVNLAGRPRDEDFRWDSERFRFLPSGAELAQWLIDQFKSHSNLKDIGDLIRVAQYLEFKEGGELYMRLHELFDGDYPPTTLHVFLARLQRHLRRLGKGAQVILTTNYDDALERAFDAADEPYDVITYVCMNPAEHRGRFMHFAPGASEPVPILRPNEYDGLKLTERSVILKMHGAVKRKGEFFDDNYVITENHYLDYLTHTDIAGLLPTPIPMKLRNSFFLFLGYGMTDWNLRVILRRIWRAQTMEFGSWSIQLKPNELEREFWGERGVEILEHDLGRYVVSLRRALAKGLLERREKASASRSS